MLHFLLYKDKYTVDGKTLIRPEKQARFLGVDEFKLHNGYTQVRPFQVRYTGM